MTAMDLQELGYHENRVLPPFWGYCAGCDRYRWFLWFIGSQAREAAVCRECKLVDGEPCSIVTTRVRVKR